MKRSLSVKALLLGVIISLFLAPSAFAQTLTYSTNFNVNLVIPDNGDEVVSAQNVQSDILSLIEIRVLLYISGGQTGDLYAYLRHNTGFSVLLNRTGTTATNSSGYSDLGFDVVFDDGASNDIHVYRDVFNPNGGILTGTWQPDGRTADPDEVTDISPRSADLSSFTGLNPNGQWELFLVDNESLSEFVLHSWGLQLVGAIPEPGTYVFFALGGLGLWLAARCKKL